MFEDNSTSSPDAVSSWKSPQESNVTIVIIELRTDRDARDEKSFPIKSPDEKSLNTHGPDLKTKKI